MLKLYAVFGDPISHSKSPILHNYVFHKLAINARYTRYHLESSEHFRELFFKFGLSGANITLPFKESVLSSCDEIRGIANKIGAINTIVREHNKLVGYNTDAIGFYKNIESKFIKNALILGAGGSAKAIAYILQEHNISVSIVNRSAKNLEFFKRAHFPCFLSEEIPQDSHFDMIINATSSSINNTLPLKESTLKHLFNNANVAFDLMYGKECAFLSLAKDSGVEAIDGAKMLLYQAIEASSLFLCVDSTKIAPIMEEAYDCLIKGTL